MHAQSVHCECTMIWTFYIFFIICLCTTEILSWFSVILIPTTAQSYQTITGNLMSSKETKDTSNLIQKVSTYCWSKGFIQIFTKYFEDNADAFIDAPEYVTGGEHDIKYYTLFEKYLILYEVWSNQFHMFSNFHNLRYI